MRTRWTAWALLVLVLHAACVTGGPRGTHPPRPVEDRVHLSGPMGFGSVRVSDSELDKALSGLILNLPLRVAGAHVPRSRNWRLARASAPLAGEAWRTPLARDYGHLCSRRETPGDCLGLFKDGPGLDGEDKRDLALALSVSAALEARDAELRGMVSTTRLWTTLSVSLIGYMALVAAPEPLSKGLAAALTLLLWGYLGWEFLDLVRAYFLLWEEAAEASTFAELREAGERFGQVIGPNSMRILLLLGTAAVGETAALVSRAPTLPGFATASGALESHVGIRDVLTAAQEADAVTVAVAEGTIRVVLPAHVVSMATRGSSTRADPPRKPEVHHIATIENSKSTARGGPWTPRFKTLFDKAGMRMNDVENTVPLEGHKGPHPERYHRLVFRDLDQAMRGCRGVAECRAVLTKVLSVLAKEIATQGSELNQLVTRGASR